jgi:putative ABC transport system permease protein
MPQLGWSDVLIAWIAMAIHLVWCLRHDRELAKTWIWGSLRSLVQLSALGYVLAFLFERDSLAWNAVAIAAMLAVSAWTVVSRTKVRYDRLPWDCLFALTFSIAIGLVPVLFLFGDSKNLRETRALLPFLGILLGNSLSGLSLGLSQWLRELRHRQSEVEFWIALGASPRQAVAKLEASAIRTALTGVLNSMAVAGIVSIPGMMTGQLLAGGDPTDAVKYQLVVLFLISAVVFGSSWIALKLSLRRLFDPWGAFLTPELGEKT